MIKRLMAVCILIAFIALVGCTNSEMAKQNQLLKNKVEKLEKKLAKCGKASKALKTAKKQGGKKFKPAMVFQKAMKQKEAGKYKKAVMMLQKIVKKAPGTPLAEKSKAEIMEIKKLGQEKMGMK